VRITKYDPLGIVAAGFAGLLFWATLNGWSVLPKSAQLAGITATVASLGAAVGMFSLDRTENFRRFGMFVFLLGIAAFMYVMYTEILIPDFRSRTGW
jgi:hypothetical protein